MKGWVYIITNKAMPNLLKVGFSTKDPESRANELHTTGVSYRYVVEYDALVNEPRDVEQKAHILLNAYNENKEWFKCDITTAIIAIRKAANGSIILQSNNDDLIPNENEPLIDPIVSPDKIDTIINPPPRGGLTPTRLFQVEFWEQLCNFAVLSKAPLIPRKPTRPQYYCDIKIIGRSDCHISMLVESKKNRVSCQLYIPNDKVLFNTFYSEKEAIEKALGIKDVEWQEKTNACRIITFYNFNFATQECEEAFTWLLQTANKFKNVFSKP